MVIDNTPFPDGIIPSIASLFLLSFLIGYEKITVSFVRKITYSSNSKYYTAAFTLVFISGMLMVVILSLIFKLWRMKSSFRKDALFLKTSVFSVSEE